jgi:hypothetical protein
MRAAKMAAAIMAAAGLAASGASAAEQTATSAAIEVLSEGCPLIIEGEHEQVAQFAENLSYLGVMGWMTRQFPQGDVLFFDKAGATAEHPSCRVTADYGPGFAADLPAAAGAWAKGRELTSQGPARRKLDEEGAAYMESVWSSDASRLVIRVYPADAKGRTNVALEWTPW